MIRVGERLQKERIKKALTLEEVSKVTKIRYSFLSALEKGNYRELPSPTYAYGFVRNYAKFLGLPDKELLALFKREYDEEKAYRVLPEGLIGKQEFPLRKIKLAQAAKLAILVFLILISYLAFQYRDAILNPPLHVDEPAEGKVIKSQKVTVLGKTSPNSTVFVNNEIASLDKDGKFRKEFKVFAGKAKITVKAVNHFGKTTIIERNIEVKPSSE